MKMGDIITLTAGKYSCKYLVTNNTPVGLTIRRVMLAKTKADNNRFQETILIAIGPNSYTEPLNNN